MSVVGELLELRVGPPAHGGFCVARHEGLAVFVRHALPGELVRAKVSEQARRYLRAEAVEVLEASPHRVPPACPVAVPFGCGGCDWQHASGGYQREIKAAIVAEQLHRLAGIDRTVVVEALPGDGFGWRTRVRFAVDAAGRAGLRRHRSHEVVAIDHCPIAHPMLEAVGVEARRWNRVSTVEVAVSVSTGAHLLRTVARPGGAARTHGPDALEEQAAGRRFRVSAGGFWQVHPHAADTLVDAVGALAGVRPGDRVLDLYAGVGLFAAALAAHIGPAGSVVAVESDRTAAGDAAHNLAGLAHVRVLRGDVGAVLARQADAGIDGADVVVLDPPRSGAGGSVVAAIAGLAPRAVVYVACDPAALARDLATFARAGYELGQLRAFDLFPQTQHVECVALLTPSA